MRTPPFLGIRRGAASPTRSNQNFKLLYIRISMNLDTKEFIEIAIENNLKKVSNPSLPDDERVEAVSLVLMLTKALREME